jgi:uncharacterized membrane protein
MEMRAAYGSRTMLREETGESRAERLVYRWSFAAIYAAAAGGIVWLWLDSGGGAVAELGTLAATSMLVVGHFIIFTPNALHGPWSLALMCWLIDVMIAFALASGLESLERTPVLGAWLKRARGRAIQVLSEYPRLERMAFLGVAIFVFLPIASTGAVTGSFAARIGGLSRLAGVLAIAIGAAGTTAIFALLAVFLGERGEEILHSPVASTATLAGAAVLGWFAFQKAKSLLRH